jgi:DedD protein
MDPQLKQRLIGAAVLVVLAIIFVPMVLDGSSTPESQTIDLAIPPAPDGATQTRVVPLDPATLPQPAPAPSSLSEAIATVDTGAAPRVDAVDAAATPGGTGVPGEPAPATAAQTSPAAVAPVPATTLAAPPVAAAAPETSGPMPAPVTGGRYVVSFGSYSRSENAQALVESLKKARIPAFAESVEVNGQAGMRVRAGPYTDRTQAEQVRLIARQARPDVPGSIVEIDNTASAPAAAAASAAVTGWSVQVGAYKAQADANAQRDKLRGGGFAAYVDVLRAEGSTLYRVRVGPEAQRADADKLRDALRARFDLNGNVVTQP